MGDRWLRPRAALGASAFAMRETGGGGARAQDLRLGAPFSLDWWFVTVLLTVGYPVWSVDHGAVHTRRFEPRVLAHR